MNKLKQALYRISDNIINHKRPILLGVVIPVLVFQLIYISNLHDELKLKDDTYSLELKNIEDAYQDEVTKRKLEIDRLHDENLSLQELNNNIITENEKLYEAFDIIAEEFELDKANMINEPTSLKKGGDYYDIPLANSLQEYINVQANSYNIDPSLVFALIQLESKFDPNATSHTNDHGLGQLNTNPNKYYSGGTLEWLAESLGYDADEFNPYNEKHSIEATTYYLNWLKELWVEKGYTNQRQLHHLILSSYNQGYPTVNKRVANGGNISSRYSKVVLNIKNTEFN